MSKDSGMAEVLEKSKARRAALRASTSDSSRTTDPNLQVVGDIQDKKVDECDPHAEESAAPPQPNDRGRVHEDDPWVPSSVKIRNSKKKRLHRLSRDREDAGFEPFHKQRLLDEALDHVLEKYGG